MMRLDIFLIICMGLAACSPADNMAEDDGVTPTVASPPIVTDNGEEQAYPPPPTETSYPYAQPESAMPAGAITFRLTGGFAGFDNTWQIYPDGRVVTDKGETFQIEAEMVERLWQPINNGEFFEFAPEYKHKQIINDNFHYDISFVDGARAHMIKTEDDAPMPAALTEMIRELMRLQSMNQQ